MASPCPAARRAPRAIVLDGALADDGVGVPPVALAVATALERAGLEPLRVPLRDVKVAPCLGCFECWTRTPGVCRTKDAGRDLARAIVRARLVAWVTAVTFGGYSSELKKAVDRLVCLALPFFMRVDGVVRHRPRYPRRPALLVVGVQGEPDPEQARIFHELARRNAANLHAPAFASLVLVRPPGTIGVLAPELRGAVASVLARADAAPSAAAGGAA